MASSEAGAAPVIHVVDATDDTVVLDLEGEFDISAAPDVARHAEEILEAGKHLVVNIRGCGKPFGRAVNLHGHGRIVKPAIGPVSKADRAGVQVGVLVYALRSSMPSCAMRSMFGVRTAGLR